MLIWAYGVNRTLERGGAPDDGTDVANNIFNMVFDGVSGQVVYSVNRIPDSKVHGANMGPTWVLSSPDGPHVVPINLAIRDVLFS